MKIKWRLIKTAPKDGSRIQVLFEKRIYHGWYEETFKTFMGMTSDWSLIKINPKKWAPLGY